MLSIKARLANYFLRTRFKPAIARLASDLDRFPERIAAFRETLEKRALKEPKPKGVNIETWTPGPGESERVTPKDGSTDWTVLYLHGGGFKFCSPRTHRAITSFLAKNTPAEVIVPDYRLAPENLFPAGLEDCMRSYEKLLEEGKKPEQIAIAGDSAGGGLALSLALLLKDRGMPLPAALALMSPYVDLTASGQSLHANADTDVMFPKSAFSQGEQTYHGDHEPGDPLVSPLFGDLSGLPPMIIHTSKAEILLDDSQRLAARAKAAGVDTTLELFDELPHVWHILCGQIPEADRDAMTIALFLRMHLGARAADRIAEKQRRDTGDIRV